MKLFNLLFLFSLLIIPMANAQVFWQDDFGGATPEMGGGTRVSSVGDPQDGTCCGTGIGADRFVRTDELEAGTCCGCASAFTNISNTWCWNGEDLDGNAPCSNSTQTLTWSGIDITGRTNIEFIGLLGIRNTTSWEAPDQFKIEYQIDGGSLVEGFCFSPTPGSTAAELNLALDEDCDLTVDGDDLSTALSEHSFSIPATGSSMAIIFTAIVNGSGEEFAIDNFRLNEGVALPVALSDFRATLKNKTILLEWQTETEVNNDRFEIEHSRDGKNFAPIGIVKGIGNSNRRNFYKTVHSTPNFGMNYYRLMQFDYDGAFTYSSIVAVNYSTKSSSISVYPNPFHQSVTLQFPTTEYNSEEKIRTIKIYDVYGKLALRADIPIDDTNVTLDLSDLNSGTYFIQSMDGKSSLSVVQRIIKL